MNMKANVTYPTKRQKPKNKKKKIMTRRNVTPPDEIGFTLDSRVFRAESLLTFQKF